MMKEAPTVRHRGNQPHQQQGNSLFLQRERKHSNVPFISKKANHKGAIPNIQRDFLSNPTRPIIGPFLESLRPDALDYLGQALGRPLTGKEKNVLTPVFGDYLNYDIIRICTNGFCSPDNVARTIGNTIAAPAGGIGNSTLIHEAAHVWQHQNGAPYGYAISALAAQGVSVIINGSRQGAYNWNWYVKNSIPWAYWNAEAQAQWIEDHKKLPPTYIWATSNATTIPLPFP